MKAILRFSFVSTATLWLYTFIVVLSSVLASCDKNSDVTPTVTPVGWGGTAIADITDNDPSGFLLLGSLTEPPRDLSVSVYYFPVSTPAVDAINSITDPEKDDDGEAMDAPDADDSFEVKLRTIEQTTNYNAKGQFRLYLLENQLAVIELTGGSRTTYAAITTAGSGKEITFDLTKARSARAAAKKAETAQYFFQSRWENAVFTARLFGDIWYFPATMADEEIQRIFNVGIGPLNLRPRTPDDTRYVQKLVNSGNYSAEGWFSKTLKANVKVVIIWNYLDARDQNYQYGFYIWQPAAPGAEVRCTIGTDAWRARL